MKNIVATILAVVCILVTLPVILPLGIAVRIFNWAISPLVSLWRDGL